MDARPEVPEPQSPAWKDLAERFARFRTPENAGFFDALARHFAHLRDHPVLPLHFEYAVTANERGRDAAEKLSRRFPVRRSRGLFSRRTRVLDVGCAYGGFLVAFAERGARVTGIERDERYVRLAAENVRQHGFDAEIVLGDATQAHPAFRGRFDLITANDVVEHVPRLETFLANLREWLAPGGAIYLEIPNGAYPPYVRKDGHHELFGIALLGFEEASDYMARHSPGGRYDTYHYLNPEAYARLFANHGLSFEVLPDNLAGLTVEGVLAQVEELRASVEAGLATVPAESRALVAQRVAEYLARVEAAPRASEEERRRFLLEYGPSFWIALARARA
jgi:2-polyprenyl-3-methyl-5-hydroxy-6-metoxy-1,4-benzoquinol methylase